MARWPVAGTVEELLGAGAVRSAMKTADSLSGARFERVAAGGRALVVKHLHVDDDWVMRAAGDAWCRAAHAWCEGLLDELPPGIDHAMLGCAVGLGRNGWGAALLLEDVAAWLVPEGTEPIGLEQHLRFLEHMADLHAHFRDRLDVAALPFLMPLSNRPTQLSRCVALLEAARSTSGVPAMLLEGWDRVAREAPAASAVAERLMAEPGPLVTPLAALPGTLVHGDWKLGNLGSRPDGRTILLDWAFPGWAPPTVDLAWYLGVNCDRLPVGHTKEDAAAAYRAALEARGVDTAPWWDEALGLSCILAFVQLGWSKTGGELAWWAERVGEAERLLARG